ncbi:MAG: DUF4336 domain-containing protein [Hyphomicrobiales bacterium]
MIRNIDKDLWVKESHFMALGCKGSTRMTILKTSQGLLIHSPVTLTNEDIEQINALGKVAHIVAPNLFHHIHFAKCATIFPDAKCWAAKGLGEKLENAPVHSQLAASQPIFDNDELVQIDILGHKLNETVFYHTASSTLITADFLYNYQSEQNTAEKLFFRALNCYGKPAVPFYHAMAVFNKRDFLISLKQISELPFTRVIMSHGRIIESDEAGNMFNSAWARTIHRLNRDNIGI